jgi:hypothetical protein
VSTSIAVTLKNTMVRLWGFFRSKNKQQRPVNVIARNFFVNVLLLLLLLLFSTYALQSSRLIVRSGLGAPNFATRRLYACHHARAPSGGRWNCRREMSGNFCLNADLHVTFRDLPKASTLPLDHRSRSVLYSGRKERIFKMTSEQFRHINILLSQGIISCELCH